MSVGCFSWCPFLRKTRKKNSPEGDKSPFAKDEGPFPKHDHYIPEVKVAAPGKAQYIKATVKEVLELLESAAGLIPVPMLQDLIGVALKIIQLCEEVSAVEQKVKALQERVGHLMVVIVDNITAKNEDGNRESVVEAAKGIETDVDVLLRILGTISADLGEISAKKRWEVVFYKSANEDTLNDCMNRLSNALEKFKLANDLREYDVIREVRGRLERLANTVDAIAVDVKVVSHKVDDLSENIQDVLKRSLAQTPAKKAVREEMPLKPEVFYGRDDLVDDIARLLVKGETSRVCILGPGGMGKTSVALAVAESPIVREYFTHSPVWMPCIGATTKDLFLDILFSQLQMRDDKQATLEKIVSNLNTSPDPRLIILDNFETPMLVSSSGTQKAVEDILRRLAEVKHVALLVTMRGSRPPCDIAIHWQIMNIQPTDESASLSIFHEIHPSSQKDQDVAKLKLMTALGNMPFAVTLMANLARDSCSTAEEMLSLWEEEGPTILSSNPEQSMNRSIKLSLESNLVKENPDSFPLLSILSLLPAGTSKDNLLRWWAPKLKHTVTTAIVTLMKVGLLVENRKQESDVSIFFVIPVVQSFMKHQRVDDDLRREVLLSCCHFVLSHACRWLDFSFPAYSKILAGEDSNIQSVLLDSAAGAHTQMTDQYMEALIAFCWHRCDTRPTLDVAGYTLSLAQTYGKECYVASALWCLGRTHSNLGSSDLSYKYLQEAYHFFDTLPNEDPNLVHLGAQCGIDLVDSSRLVLEDDNEKIQLALKVESKCATLSGEIHGRSLVFVGLVFCESQNMEQALVYLEQAKVVLMAVGSTSSLAEAYQAIARVYCQQDQFSEATNVMQEAWNLAERSGSSKLREEIATEFGGILISADRPTEGWIYLQTALARATATGARGEVARALLFIGYAYLGRTDYENAYGAFEAAMDKWTDGEPVWLKTCRFNMQAIRQKQGNPNADVEFLRPWSFGGRRYFNPNNLDSSSQASSQAIHTSY